ncbi:hypothetical protein O23A_p0479 [Aeromonas salmonicida]|nr:hypothetical protein O23A_p0479 [Aeromonas salmonicida]
MNYQQLTSTYHDTAPKSSKMLRQKEHQASKGGIGSAKLHA